MPEPKYFNDYALAKGNDYNFRDIFVEQKNLCEKLPQLEKNGINNLTLRLCLSQNSFSKLFDQTLEVRQKTDKFKNYDFELHLDGASTSGIVRMEAIPRESANPREKIDLDLHNIHEQFYLFCTFSVSTLDRLAVEIKDCYELSEILEREIDWGYFFRKNRKKELAKIRDKIIYKILSNSKNDCFDVREKRNILEHRTFFEIQPGIAGTNFDYFIEGKIPLVDFALNQFKRIVILCNQVYKAIGDDLN